MLLFDVDNKVTQYVIKVSRRMNLEMGSVGQVKIKCVLIAEKIAPSHL